MGTTALNREQIRNAALVRADMPANSFVSNFDANVLIDAAMAEWWDELTTVFEDYAISNATVSTTSGEDEYALPAEFWKLRSVQLEGTSVLDTVTLEPFAWAERDLWPDDPPSGKTVRLHYVKTFPQFTDDVATIDFYGWHDFVVVDVARRMRDKEETDTTSLAMELERIRQRMHKAARQRDAGHPWAATRIRTAGHLRSIHARRRHGDSIVYCLRGDKLVLRRMNPTVF